MDKLAVELLTEISFFACTDGGRTGCSLSLVSKRIHYASRPARFYSVSLVNSPAQIELFLACYEAERARAVDMIPRVRHLCLSFFGKGLAALSASASTPAPKPRTREEFMAFQRRHILQRNSIEGHYSSVIPALMRAVSPDLWTLAIMQAQWKSASVVRCSFPCLEELTIVGGDPSFLPFKFIPDDKPLYPALKRLHHILSIVNKDVDFHQWARHAPKLTHLRISRLDSDPRITVDSLAQVIGPDAPADVFPLLKQVIVQPHPGPAAGTDGRDTTLTVSYRAFLSHLNKTAHEARVPLQILPAMEVPKAMHGADPSRGCIQKLEGLWRSRLEGGGGCWDQAIGESRGFVRVNEHSAMSRSIYKLGCVAACLPRSVG